MNVRRLDSEGEPLLEAFFLPHRDSSMFLRASLTAGGLDHTGPTSPETSVGAFQDADESLNCFDLSNLRVPVALSAVEVASRPPPPAERDTLCGGQRAYEIKTVGDEDTVESQGRSIRVRDQKSFPHSERTKLSGAPKVKRRGEKRARPPADITPHVR